MLLLYTRLFSHLLKPMFVWHMIVHHKSEFNVSSSSGLHSLLIDEHSRICKDAIELTDWLAVLNHFSQERILYAAEGTTLSWKLWILWYARWLRSRRNTHILLSLHSISEVLFSQTWWSSIFQLQFLCQCYDFWWIFLGCLAVMNCHKNSGFDGWPEHRLLPAIAAAAPEWEGWCLWQELGNSNDFYWCMGGTSSTKSWSIHYQWWSSAIGYLLRKKQEQDLVN